MTNYTSIIKVGLIIFLFITVIDGFSQPNTGNTNNEAKFDKDKERPDVTGLKKIGVLIDRNETEKTETGWNCWKPALEGPVQRNKEKDLVFFIVEGKARSFLARLLPFKYPFKKMGMVGPARAL